MSLPCHVSQAIYIISRFEGTAMNFIVIGDVWNVRIVTCWPYIEHHDPALVNQ